MQITIEKMHCPQCTERTSFEVLLILKTDPGVYDDIAGPVLLLLRQRLGSSWRNVPKKRKPRSMK